MVKNSLKIVRIIIMAKPNVSLAVIFLFLCTSTEVVWGYFTEKCMTNLQDGGREGGEEG